MLSSPSFICTLWMSSEVTGLENETPQKEYENDLKRCQKILWVCVWGGGRDISSWDSSKTSRLWWQMNNLESWCGDKWPRFKVGGPPILDTMGASPFSQRSTSKCMDSWLPVGYVGVVNALALGLALLLLSCVVWGKLFNQPEFPCL